MQPLRDYQTRAVAQVRAHHEAWRAGRSAFRRVMLVSPPGSGKTRMGEELVLPYEHATWFAHRQELVRDAAERLQASLGKVDVGIISPGHPPSPHSRVQVISIQTARRRSELPPAGIVVFDEFHHLAADDWSLIANHYQAQPMVGLTGTPSRQDGRALADICDVMVVAATYDELLSAGHLAQCKGIGPQGVLTGGIAMDPCEAWLKFADGSPGFAFFNGVAAAYECEAAMSKAGVRAAVIEQKTPKHTRAGVIAGMRSGALDCICNVQTMTEGVDIPRARVCMLASPVTHCGGYLQRTARVLRPYPGKAFAIIIDLVGAYLLHGSPIDNREYSLDGKPIRRLDTTPLRQCLRCFAMIAAGPRACPYCQAEHVPEPRKMPRIYSEELREVYAGPDTPKDAKLAEYHRLRKMQQTNGYDLHYVRKVYKELFGEDTIIHDATKEEKLSYLGKLKALQQEKQFKPGFVFVRFKETFGHAPPR